MQNKKKPITLPEAALAGNITSVKSLLKAGADINKQDKDGNIALINAARYGHDIIVRLWLKRKTDAKTKKRTDLIDAKSYVMVKLLLEANADANIQNKNERTALMEAALYHRDTVVQLLLEA